MVENLFGEFDIAFGPAGAGVIGQDRFAETGRFGQADAARDDGAEDLVRKNSRRSAATWRVRLVRSSYMVSRMPSICEGVVEGFADPVDGIHELGDAFQGEELALDGDEDGIGGDEGVEGEEIEGGGAIDQDEVVVVADLRRGVRGGGIRGRSRSTSSRLAPTRFLSAGMRSRPSNSVGTMASSEVGIAEEDVVEAGLVGIFGDAEAAGGVALGVGVDDEDPNVVGCQGSGEIDGGGGFPDAALLVGNGEDSAQAFRLTCCFT